MFGIILNKKNISVVAIILIVLAGALYLIWQYGRPAEDSGMILFYSKDCSHCANVEEYIKANEVESKVNFTQLEISDNQKNVELLAQKALYCKVDISQGVPVPFLWEGEKCLIGDEDIIQFFQDAIK